ncbi:hypothetical protein [Devosia sp. CN2-171]|uniref:hypothetical protein n=1 Tax=Devosia sp. CN2-171 TaxID=3400909 RepID=UPI003BF7B84D
MLNPAHILETAFLLLAAFLIGAVVGSLAKLLVLRLRPAKPAVAAPATVVTEAVVEQPALVAAPVIEPTARPAQPEAPAEVPTPDFSEVAQSIATAKADVAPLSEIKMPKVTLLPSIAADAPAPAMAPAREAGRATSGKQVTSPRLDDVAAAPAAATGPSADVIPFPIERAAHVDEVTAAPAPTAESAQAADVEVVYEAQAPAAAVAETAQPELRETPEPTVVAAVVPEPVPVVAEVAPESAPAAETEKTPQPEAAKADARAALPHEDETAAMRAIEGTWSPRRNAGRRTTKVPAPEGVALDEMMVADAPAADEAPGKPAGLPAPRGGVKDNLTNVIGVLPVIETSLNSIGVYHFDQIGAFSDENVAWLEGHLGIPGRVDREHWREQARELAVISDRARKVAGQQ